MIADRFEKELGELLESGDPTPRPEAGARQRAIAAMRRAAVAGPARPLAHRILGKGERKMRRFAFAVVFLAFIGAVATGVFTRSAPPDAHSMLVSAAQAMEDAQTVHVVGRANSPSPEGYPWGKISEGRYEMWYTPRGSRTDNHDGEGNLICSVGQDIEAGRAWTYGWYDRWFGSRGVFKVFQVDGQEVAPAVAYARSRLVEGERWFDQAFKIGAKVTRRSGMWNGQPATILHMDRTAPNGEPLGTTDAYLDAQGRLLGFQAFSPEEYGGELTAEMELVEYDVEPPADLFEIQPPPGVPVTMDFAEPYPGPEILEIDYFSCAYGPRYRVVPTAGWRARAFSSATGTRPSMAIDGDYATRWVARGRQHAQEKGMWFEVIFDAPVQANKLLVHNYRDGYAELAVPEVVPAAEAEESESGAYSGTGGGMSGPAETDTSRLGTGWPLGAQVSITTDGATWQDVPTGQAAAELPIYANFGAVRQILGIRITLTQTTDEEPWSIAEVNLFGPPHD